MTNPACRHCGESLEEDCVGEGCGKWETVERPPGCVCDPREWGDENVLPVCHHFTVTNRVSDAQVCACGHERECHEGE